MSTADLETLVSQAVYAASMLERALHDTGPWTMTWGPHVVEATRTIHPTGVVFDATFPDTCWIERPAPNLVLRCDGEVVAVRTITFPGDAAFAVTLALATAAAVPA